MTIEVTARYFAAFRERAGCDSELVSTDTASTMSSAMTSAMPCSPDRSVDFRVRIVC